ncbi:MAG: type II secretion system F family protein [Desulfuromonadaceae bacterium]
MVEREFDAINKDMLRESLEEQGFHVFHIRKKSFQILHASEAKRSQFGGRRFLSFNQELLVLIRSGLAILQVLDTIIERLESGRLRDVLREIREDVKGGAMLSEAFGKFPRYFPPLYVASLKAGEKTGDLPVTLGRYIVYQKRVEALKSKVKGAAFYPVLLSFFVIGVLLFLMLFVVPRFTQIYADAQVQLPLVTRMLIASVEYFTTALPLAIPLFIAGFFLLRWYVRTEAGMLRFARVKLQLPFFGLLLSDYAISGFSRTFATTLASGITVVQSMRMARGTLNNRYLEKRLGDAIRKVEEGMPIASSLEQTGFFPSLALRMIGVGESTGALADMLNDVAEFYEGEVERLLDRLTTLVEPIMMLSMGLLIGGIIIAMYIPIFQMGTVVS